MNKSQRLHLHKIPLSCFDDSSNPECGNQVTCRLPAVGLALNASCPEDNTVREPQVGYGGKADRKWRIGIDMKDIFKKT